MTADAWMIVPSHSMPSRKSPGFGASLSVPPWVCGIWVLVTGLRFKSEHLIQISANQNTVQLCTLSLEQSRMWVPVVTGFVCPLDTS